MSPGGDEKLGRILIEIAGDNALLKKQLAESERRAKTSTTKMKKGLSGMSAEMQKAGVQMKRFNTGFTEGFQKSQMAVDQLGMRLGNLAGLIANPFVLGAIAIGGLTIALGKSISEAARFEKEFANVTTLFDLAEQDAVALENALLDLDATLGDTIELTRASYQAISAGIQVADAPKAVAEAAMFASAALVDQFTAIDVGTTVINAYGREIEDLNQIYAVLFKTIEQGKTTGQELAGSLGMVIPFAAALEVPLEELSAALAAMTKGGVKTDVAVTALRQTLATFLSPSKQAKDLAKKLGVELNATAIKSDGFLLSLQKLAKASEGNSEAITTFFGNIRSLTAVLALTGKQAEEFELQVRNMFAASQNHAIAHEKQLDTLIGQWNRLMTIVDKFQLLVGGAPADALKVALREIADEAQELFNEIRNLNSGKGIAGLTKRMMEFGDSLDPIEWGIDAVGAVSVKLGNSLDDNLNVAMAANAAQSTYMAERLKRLAAEAAAAADGVTDVGEAVAQLTDEQRKATVDLIAETEKLKIQLINKDSLDEQEALLMHSSNLLLREYEGFEADRMAIAENYDAKRALITEKRVNREKKAIEQITNDIIKGTQGNLAYELAKLEQRAIEKKKAFTDEATAELMVGAWLEVEKQNLRDKETKKAQEQSSKLLKKHEEYLDGLNALFMTEEQEIATFYQGQVALLNESLALGLTSWAKYFEGIAILSSQSAAEMTDLETRRRDDLMNSLQDEVNTRIDLNTKATELSILSQSGDIAGFMEALDQKTAANIAYYEGANELQNFYAEMMIESQRTLASYTAEIGQALYSQISSGIVDIIVMGADAEEVLKNIGKNMISMILEFMIQRALASAMSVALWNMEALFISGVAGTVAAAWAPAAAMASLATLGSNAALAAAALTGTVALAEGLAAGTSAASGSFAAGMEGAEVLLPGMATGGLAKTPTVAVIAEQEPEYVLPASLVDKFKGGGEAGVLIERINLNFYGDIREEADLDMIASLAAGKIADEVKGRMRL